MNYLIEQEVITNLHNGCVRFTFKKKDGSIRQASGTLLLNKIPLSHRPKTGRRSSPKVVPYFDLDKMEWRCFLKGSVVGLIEIVI